ncbi:hypothetical protein STEG23_029782 [Scotinomys teguina]
MVPFWVYKCQGHQIQKKILTSTGKDRFSKQVCTHVFQSTRIWTRSKELEETVKETLTLSGFSNVVKCPVEEALDSSQKFGLYLPSIHNSVFFMIRKIEIIGLPHAFLFADDTQADVFGAAFTLCTSSRGLCMWTASRSAHSFLSCSPSDIPDLKTHHSPKHLLSSNFLLSKTFTLQGKLVGNRMCRGMRKQSIVQGCSPS